MPIARFQLEDGRIAKFEVPEGTTPEAAQSMMERHFNPAPASVMAGKALNSVPRQLGLTARYALEGAANTAQIVTEPLRYLTDSLTPGKATSKPLGAFVSQLADSMGMPKPEGADERVIGDATKMGFGAMGGGGALQKLGGLGSEALQFAGKSAAPVMQSVSQKLTQMMGANLGQQATAAAGAGLAGGASREAGGGDLLQAGAALVGGVAGGAGAAAAPSVVNLAKTLLSKNMTVSQIDERIGALLRQSGVDYSQVPERLRQGMRAEMTNSLQLEKEMSPAAVSRLLDFKRVGATPTRGMLSQDPIQITQEMNLAKTGANTNDAALHGMAKVQNDNNAVIIRNLNESGAGSDVNALNAGRLVNDKIAGTQSALQKAETDIWEAAKALPGYKQPIFPDGLNAAVKSLDEEGMMAFMSKPITDYMAVFQTGQQPFTPQAYRNLQSMLSAEMKTPGNSARAARIARDALESTPMKALTETGRDIGSTPVTSGMAAQLRAIDSQPNEAIAAVNQARAATNAKYSYERSSPLVKSSLGESRAADPEKIAQSFVINGTLNDAKAVANEVGPEGMRTIRDALMAHIKKEALSGAADDTGKVSQAAMNTAIRKFGDEKLALFFAPEELAQLKATGRVATLMMNQPVGSAVNNSNSAAMMVGKVYDVTKRGVGMIPGVGPVGAGLLDLTLGNPTKNANTWLAQRAAQNARSGLLMDQTTKDPLSKAILPGLAMGGLLAAP